MILKLWWRYNRIDDKVDVVVSLVGGEVCVMVDAGQVTVEPSSNMTR